MTEGEHLPTHEQLGKAGLAAAAAAGTSIVFAALPLLPPRFMGMAILIPIFAIPIGLLHVWMFALPLYSRLRRRWALRWWNAALGGFFVGAVPITLLGMPGLFNAILMDAGPVVYGGPPLLLSVLLYLLEAGLPGLVGGLTFWLVLRRSGSCR